MCRNIFEGYTVGDLADNDLSFIISALVCNICQYAAAGLDFKSDTAGTKLCHSISCKRIFVSQDIAYFPAGYCNCVYGNKGSKSRTESVTGACSAIRPSNRCFTKLFEFFICSIFAVFLTVRIGSVMNCDQFSVSGVNIGFSGCEFGNTGSYLSRQRNGDTISRSEIGFKVVYCVSFSFKPSFNGCVEVFISKLCCLICSVRSNKRSTCGISNNILLVGFFHLCNNAVERGSQSKKILNVLLVIRAIAAFSSTFSYSNIRDCITVCRKSSGSISLCLSHIGACSRECVTVCELAFCHTGGRTDRTYTVAVAGIESSAFINTGYSIGRKNGNTSVCAVYGEFNNTGLDSACVIKR